MTETVLPADLVQKCLALVQRTHQTLSPRMLSRKIATRRNAVTVMMLPEASAILGAATSAFKIRVLLWVLAAAALVLSPFLTGRLLILTGLGIAFERAVARRERQFWVLIAAMLLAVDILASDFAGWGSAFPVARLAAAQALGSASEGAPIAERLDHYLPRRGELSDELVRAFGPQGAK